MLSQLNAQLTRSSNDHEEHSRGAGPFIDEMDYDYDYEHDYEHDGVGTKCAKTG